jgi:hypothetical protein
MRTVRTPRAAGAVFGIIFCAILSLSFQDKPQESVTVTAVEVPVRVFDKNGFITGLTKDDFEVFENGVKQDITGFEAVSRTISPVPIALPEGVQKSTKKRNFLLIFNVFDYTKQVGEAIDYFFRSVYREDDRLIIVVEDKILSVGAGEGIDATIAGLKKALIALKKITRIEITKAFLDVEREANSLASTLGESGSALEPEGESQHIDPAEFFEKYRRIWVEYRNRMLAVDMNFYRGVIRKIDRLDGDKWAICFQQRDLFPKLKSLGRLDTALNNYLMSTSGEGGNTVIQARKRELDQSFDYTQSFPAERLRALFTEANMTFHVLIMKSLYQGVGSGDLELQDVRADYEDVLRGVSQATGGLTTISNNVLDSLKEAAGKEDKYYMLVYQSKDRSGAGERKIDIKGGKEGADVVSLKQFVGQKPELIKIAAFDVKGKQIGFDVTSGIRLEQRDLSAGKIAVRVSIFDAKSAKVFNQAKAFDLMADSIHISLSFEKSPPGDYFVIIEAVDLVAGEKDVLARAIVL